MNFAKKRFCRTDVTQKTLGPGKVLGLKVDQFYKNSIQNGWLLNIDPEYKMGKKYVMNLKEVLVSDQNDEKMGRDLDKQKNNLKHDFKQREKYLESYLKEVNEKYDFALDPKEKNILKEKLRVLIDSKQEQWHQPRPCVRMRNVQDLNLFEIEEIIREKQEKKHHPMGLYPEFLSDEIINSLERTECMREEKPTFNNTELVLKSALHKLDFQDSQISKEAQIKAAQERFNESVYLIAHPEKPQEEVKLHRQKIGKSKFHTTVDGRRASLKSDPAILQHQHSK